MKYLHTMVRVTDLDASLDFYCDKLGLVETGRFDNEGGRFTLVFLAAPGDEEAQVELTHNWDEKDVGGGRNFGHLAYRVKNIYELCQHMMDKGVTILRPLVTAIWPLFAHQMEFQSNSSKKESLSILKSLGPQWKTPANGRTEYGRKFSTLHGASIQTSPRRINEQTNW